MFVGYGILPPVYSHVFRRHVDYRTPRVRSPFSRGTSSTAHSCPSSVFYNHDAMSSAAFRRSASVNSTSFHFRELRILNLRELSPSTYASSRRDIPSHSSLLPRPPRHFVATLRRIPVPRHAVATLRRSAPRRSPSADVQPRRSPIGDVQSPMFNRVEVQPRRHSTVQSCSICIRFHVAVVTVFQPLLMQILRRELYLPRSRSSYLQFLQTVHIQTLKMRTVHSRLQLQQLLLTIRLSYNRRISLRSVVRL